MRFTFDTETHTYAIDGRRVPSVTEIVNTVVPQFQADAYYLQRGSAVHACAALIAKGQDFTCDPRIAGYVEAIRLFYTDFAPVPMVCEEPMYSARLRCAGTPDLLSKMHGAGLVLIDWKNSLSKAVKWQLGGYSALLREQGHKVKSCFGVELHENGTYKKGDTYSAADCERGFLAIYSAFSEMKKEGVIK